jgi:nucleoside-diphosphate-sugar epimerase
MSSTKLITVFGATGKQGGAVVQTFLNDPKLKGHWRVRGITRDHTKDSAKKLAAQGVECVSVSRPVFLPSTRAIAMNRTADKSA